MILLFGSLAQQAIWTVLSFLHFMKFGCVYQCPRQKPILHRRDKVFKDNFRYEIWKGIFLTWLLLLCTHWRQTPSDVDFSRYFYSCVKQQNYIFQIQIIDDDDDGDGSTSNINSGQPENCPPAQLEVALYILIIVIVYYLKVMPSFQSIQSNLYYISH